MVLALTIALHGGGALAEQVPQGIAKQAPALPDASGSVPAISEWNVKANAIATGAGQSALVRAHSLAVLHVAMFEAMNVVERQSSPRKLDIPAERNASLEAAVAAAAHDVLVALYPDHSADLSSTLAMSLARIADDVPKARGYAVGKIVAAAVLSRWFFDDRRQAGCGSADWRPHGWGASVNPDYSATPADGSAGTTGN
jgi:hypothetical protein